MPTYYVSQSTGLNTNNGTSPVTPWQTLAFALGAASGTNPGLVGGDIIYIAPGTYNESVTINFASPSSTVQIIGDPLNSQGFPNVSGGNVLWWHGTNAVLIATSKNNISLSNIYFERTTTNQAFAVTTTTCYNWTLTKCVIVSGISATSTSPNAQNWTISRCIVCAANNQDGISFTTGAGANYALNINITDCLLFSTTGGGATSNIATRSGNGNGGLVTNCTMLHPNVNIQLGSSNTTNKLMVQNCLCMGLSAFYISPSGQLDSQNNRYLMNVGFNGVVGTGSTTGGLTGLDFGNARLFGYGLNDFFGSNTGSPNIGFGTSVNAPTSDLYGQTWASLPDAGAVQRSALSNFQPPTAPYVAAERNASTITIAPGSTSQSIELYLGATGLTASTANLSARYNRTRTASVSIPLVARTIAQAWTAGGFAEVDATNMPGVYRLDLPDAALAAGADDVTVVVRGAYGTNGAVMTIKLSSGGLTSAQTASAVWGASPGPYNDATTMGGIVNEIDTLANGIDINVTQTPILVWDELKSNHTTPGTFGDYLDAKVSDVADTARIQLRQGPFLIKQNAVDSVITEVNQFLSTVPNIEMVLIDSSGGSVSVAGATLVMRVRNQAGTAVVNNITPTVAYADGGVIRWSPNLSWTALGVTTAGTYRIVVERTMSGVTTTFGPFLVQLSSG